MDSPPSQFVTRLRIDAQRRPAGQYLQRARGAGGVLWIPVVFVAFWSSGSLVGDIGTRAAPPLAVLF